MGNHSLSAKGGLLALTITALWGCSFSPPPNGSLRCATGSRLCPDGYICSDVTNTCWKKGTLPDASGIDTGDAISPRDAKGAAEVEDGPSDLVRTDIPVPGPDSTDAASDVPSDVSPDLPAVADLSPVSDTPLVADGSFQDGKLDQAVADKPAVVDAPCPDGGCCYAGAACVPANPCHSGTQDCSGGTAVCTDTGTAIKDGTNCGTNLVCSAGACLACTENVDCVPTGTTTCTAGTACTPNNDVCKTGQTSCATGASVCGSTGSVPDSSAIPCAPGKICLGGTCSIIPGCPSDGSAGLGCPCSSSGSNKCSSLSARPNKLPLICTGGVWVVPTSGSPCTSAQNCNWDTGVCADIDPQCNNHPAGFQYCTKTNPADSYTGDLNTCGTDLVTLQTRKQTCNGVCGPGGTNGSTCLDARCGDGKVESGETCDDGNDNPVDGCEPYSAPTGVGCTPSRVVSLTLGGRHACALYNGGYVRCWGNNEVGQLGLGHAEFQGDLKPYELTNANRSAKAGPINLGGSAVDVKAGYDFTCALLTDQTVRCWGLNDQGQLGLGNTTDYKTSTPSNLGPVNVSGSVSSISVGDSATCVILSTNALRCWGYNDTGMLGLGNINSLSSSTPANLLSTVTLGTGTPTAVSVGMEHTCVVVGGAIRCFGDNTFGELGLGAGGGDPSSTKTPNLYGPVAVPSGDTAVAISTGTDFACARMSDGSAECWGRNAFGQLGVGTSSDVGDNEPATAGVVQAGGKSIAAIAAGTSHTCAILGGGGGMRCWGDNSKGQLGYADEIIRGNASGTVPGSISAVSFGGTLSASAVFAGNLTTCALLSDGTVRCWGWNNSGQLGLGFVSVAPTDYVGGDSSHTPDVASATTAQLLPP